MGVAFVKDGFGLNTLFLFSFSLNKFLYFRISPLLRACAAGLLRCIFTFSASIDEREPWGFPKARCRVGLESVTLFVFLGAPHVAKVNRDAQGEYGNNLGCLFALLAADRFFRGRIAGYGFHTQ